MAYGDGGYGDGGYGTGGSSSGGGGGGSSATAGGGVPGILGPPGPLTRRRLDVPNGKTRRPPVVRRSMDPLRVARQGAARRQKKPPLGTGQRFSQLKSKLASRPGVTDPGALAAYIGRRSLGKAKFQSLAAKGRPGY